MWMQADELKEIKNVFRKVDGWLTYHEGLFLFNLAKKIQAEGVIVEVGSWKGRSTVCMAKGSKAGSKARIFAIDPHTDGTFDEFWINIKNANVDDIVIPIVKTSEEAAKGWVTPIDFIFIDGSHEYELVKRDFELWFPYIKEGCIMAFHDVVGWEGPRRLVDEKIVSSQNFKDVSFVDSILYARKVNSNNFIDKMKGRINRLIQKIEFRLNPSKFDNRRYRSSKLINVI
jgi:predicted O-methyltransferase YrrM